MARPRQVPASAIPKHGCSVFLPPPRFTTQPPPMSSCGTFNHMQAGGSFEPAASQARTQQSFASYRPTTRARVTGHGSHASDKLLNTIIDLPLNTGARKAHFASSLPELPDRFANASEYCVTFAPHLVEETRHHVELEIQGSALATIPMAELTLTGNARDMGGGYVALEYEKRIRHVCLGTGGREGGGGGRWEEEVERGDGEVGRSGEEGGDGGRGGEDWAKNSSSQNSIPKPSRVWKILAVCGPVVLQDVS